MANKTKPEDAAIEDFLGSIENEQRRGDAQKVAEIMHEITGELAVMWGSSMVGYGKHHYRYDTGYEGDIMAVGFSPRKQGLVLYGVMDYEQNLEQAKKLGGVKLGKGCIYVSKLDDVDTLLLKQMIKDAYENRGVA